MDWEGGYHIRQIELLKDNLKMDKLVATPDIFGKMGTITLGKCKMMLRLMGLVSWLKSMGNNKKGYGKTGSMLQTCLKRKINPSEERFIIFIFHKKYSSI